MLHLGSPALSHANAAGFTVNFSSASLSFFLTIVFIANIFLVFLIQKEILQQF